MKLGIYYYPPEDQFVLVKRGSKNIKTVFYPNDYKSIYPLKIGKIDKENLSKFFQYVGDL